MRSSSKFQQGHGAQTGSAITEHLVLIAFASLFCAAGLSFFQTGVRDASSRLNAAVSMGYGGGTSTSTSGGMCRRASAVQMPPTDTSGALGGTSELTQPVSRDGSTRSVLDPIDPNEDCVAPGDRQP